MLGFTTKKGRVFSLFLFFLMVTREAKHRIALSIKRYRVAAHKVLQHITNVFGIEYRDALLIALKSNNRHFKNNDNRANI